MTEESPSKATAPAPKASAGKSAPLKKKARKLRSRRSKKLPRVPIIIIAAVIVIVAAVGIPVATSNITKESTITESQLQDAINISSLSSAEFVYNGIAEKRHPDSDEVAYSISYDATLKAGVPMDQIKFDIDNEGKVIYPLLPKPIITSISVDINSINYLPENPDSDIREVVQICENDIESEASDSGEFQRAALENLRDIIEALTLPLLTDAGYTIQWIDE